jgi:ribonuclease R
MVLGEHCSEREQRAEAAERELTKLKLLHYLSHHIGMRMDAVITGVHSFGIFAQGVELPAEGLIHVTALADDYYDYDAVSHTLCGRRAGNRYRLGDTIRVEIVHVDLDRRELDFRLLRKRKSTAKEDSRPAGKAPRKVAPRRTRAPRSGTGKKASAASPKRTRKGKGKKKTN